MKGPAELSPHHTGPRQDHPLGWEYVSAWFDNSGSVYRHNNEARLRFSSYDKRLLERTRVLLGGGSVTGEPHPHGEYFRLTLTGRSRITRALNEMLPHLQRKRTIVQDWLNLNMVKEETSSISRRLKLKNGKYVKRELRHLKESIRQLTTPPEEH
jgi:hypothetical protein